MLIWGVTAISGRENPTEVNLRESLVAQETMLEISSIAQQRSGSLDTQVVATNIVATTTSDRNNIAELYRSSFGSPPSEPETQTVEEVDSTTGNFDTIYRQRVVEYIEISLQRLNYVYANTSDEDLLRAVGTAIENHEAHLSQLQ